MGSALRIVEDWCNRHNLSVNPSKTELILFTNKRKLDNLKLPKLFGTHLKLSSEVKYLGVILDNKLLWNKHLENKLERACIAFWQCKRLMGKTWGLSPKITLWLYNTVIKPLLTYGAVVWWPRTELSTTITKLQQFQRLACSAITGCMRTTPTAALEVILSLPPLDLIVKQEATMAAMRLRNTGIWNTNGIGPHTKILDRAIQHQKLLLAPCDSIPQTQITERNYVISLQETERDQSGIRELRIYTDGSKMSSGTGAGVFSLDLNIQKSVALGKYSSIFQCECVAIIQAASTVRKRKVKGYDIRILSDSAAVLQALNNDNLTSGLIYECHRELQKMALTNKVTLQWIKGHSGSLGLL
ncbi:uncharacterized protein LOC126368267 [Pectinophora gossypiella]|uniref:uncharacterized protein LOC126368267 n=1 Tax=Pectinophora gossypiella TaxID=13191 RepID=UPI00214EDE4A|nr:uncharacterized protein LOC126368267 [Pectinophora gossypiella]